MKRVLILSALFAFAVTLTVGQSDASVIKKAPHKVEFAQLLKKSDNSPVVNLNVDAEYFPLTFEVATQSIKVTQEDRTKGETPETITFGTRGPPNIRYLRC